MLYLRMFVGELRQFRVCAPVARHCLGWAGSLPAQRPIDPSPGSALSPTFPCAGRRWDLCLETVDSCC